MLRPGGCEHGDWPPKAALPWLAKIKRPSLIISAVVANQYTTLTDWRPESPCPLSYLFIPPLTYPKLCPHEVRSEEGFQSQQARLRSSMRCYFHAIH